jgi:hypothetical protein
MSRKLFALTSLALLSVLPLLTTTIRAEPNVAADVKVTNISGLERRAAGGHKAKVTYKVTLPSADFKLKQIKGNIEFKLSDGKVQKGEYIVNNPKLEDTIEVAAPGQLLAVDQEPVAIKADVSATTERPFNGFSTASFRIDGTKISETDGTDPTLRLGINIPKISDFKRQALGGHQVKVHYSGSATTTGLQPKQLRVKATFQLAGGKTQTNTVVKNNPTLSELSDATLVDTDGKLLAADGETKQIDTQVAIDAVVNKTTGDSRTETCGGGECKR